MESGPSKQQSNNLLGLCQTWEVKYKVIDTGRVITSHYHIPACMWNMH